MQAINSWLSPNYYVDKKHLLGQGSYGDVYKCINIKDKNQNLVMKRIKLTKINKELPEIYIYQ